MTGPEKFADLGGTVGFVDEAEEIDDGNDIGILRYWPSRDGEPAGYHVWVRLPRDDLAQMTERVNRGLPLRSINFDVPGLGFGWGSDGSKKKWDNLATPTHTIRGYRLFFGQPEEIEDVAEGSPAPMATSTTDIAILAALRHVGRSTQYVLYVLIAIGVLTVWHH